MVTDPGRPSTAWPPSLFDYFHDYYIIIIIPTIMILSMYGSVFAHPRPCRPSGSVQQPHILGFLQPTPGFSDAALHICASIREKFPTNTWLSPCMRCEAPRHPSPFGETEANNNRSRITIKNKNGNKIRESNSPAWNSI